MEGEGAPVTAATGVLGPVVAKLGTLLGSKYKLRRRTRKDVKSIKSKLKYVHSILWMVWGKETLDAQSKELKKEALDLADDMHDAIDDFILTMEPSRRNKHLMMQIKIEASPFEGFRTRVDDVVVRCRNKWTNKSAQPISNLFSRKKNTNPRIPPPPPRAPFVHKDAAELVGMGKWRNDLITYLVGGGGEEEATTVQLQLKMASIVGMAGVGKTTLASLVYEEIGNKFQSQAFVSVTPTPNMKEVLTSILQQLGAEPPTGTQARTEEHIIHTISSFLENKRYLVIIDDIWHHGEWDIIRRSFPENNLGSRIFITTRIASLPGDDLDNSKLYIRMNPIWSSEKERWFYGHDTNWLYMPDEEEEDVVARMKPEIVGEGFDCDHPVQQEQLGVHVKACDVQDMIEKQAKQSGIQNTPGFEPLVESLQLGYTNLPHHMLKTCLLYCSIYPENYPFHMNDFVMRWVAEGFIYKEDTGKDYFEELCNKGFMLHVEGPLVMPCYQMNPMMRNFLGWKLREDNFITCSSDITPPYACPIHRLCIDDYLVDDGAVEVVDTLLELDWSQIRSLVVFEGAKRYVPFEKLERVRVLDLQYHQQYLVFEKYRLIFLGDVEVRKALGIHHVKDICGLLSVRHLFGLEGTGISEIPLEIVRLQHLETLQVRFTWITELPSEIGDLQQLKTLVVSRNAKLAKLPREIGDLQHLETLDLSYNSLTELPREIGNLQNLKNLNLYATKLEELPPETWKLQHLKTLDAGDTRITRLGTEIGDLHHLETLNLSYNEGLTQLPREMWKLENLKWLLLNGTGVVRIPREIRGLKKLEILKLDSTIIALPWEASQLPKLEGVPECVRQAWKKSDLVSELAGEILSIKLVSSTDYRGGLIVGRKHMHIPRWIKDHLNDLGSLDISICKLEEQDLKILREMPNLEYLTLRLVVIPRKPIAISGEGFPRLWTLVVDSRCVPRFTFQEGAMPRLHVVHFEFQFYGGPPPPANKHPLAMGIKHLQCLWCVKFRCNEEWYGGAAESSLCMSTMIDVVRKEAQEHPNEIEFSVSGRKREDFPANEERGHASSSGTSKMDNTRNSGTGDIAAGEEETFPAKESGKVSTFQQCDRRDPGRSVIGFRDKYC
ncbi:Disease resistance protein RPP13 [Triticum urartu]|uniref:Disease resistance protein RPP13 n=1 Tax=Triticum urartu TaxID=4572 RepID=M7Z931_TRIUA|nr:Disease resistance protein RPP13 [Triticum urartu]